MADNKQTGEEMKKLNCWEFKKCGREPGGVNSVKLGVCPASTNTILDRVNKGKNSGRVCWIVAGTMCNGDVQGTFAQKNKNCEQCDFYLAVKDEEGDNFVPIEVLYRLLNSGCL